MRSLSLIGVIFFTSLALAKVNLPDALHSRDEQIQYLLYLQSEIPDLFEQGAEYDVNFLGLIEDQNKLVAALQDNRTYLELSSQKPPLKEIIIGSRETKKTQDQVFGFATLASDLRAAGLGTNENFQTREFVKQIVKVQQLPGLLTGLIGIYPAELKSKAFKLKTHSEKVAFLRANPIENAALKAKFKAQRYGLTENKWEKVLSLVEELNRHELEAGSLMTSEGQLQIPGDVQMDKAASVALEKVKQSLLNQYSSKQSAVASGDVVPELRLVEVPPNVGVFRGLVGGDCSTNMSFPYVYMPQERTYFVYSTTGNVLGYLQGTIAKGADNDQTYFYIHSISGASLSRRQIQLALHALAKKSKELGYDSILLPSQKIIHRNINYVAIHDVLYSMVDQLGPGLIYPDNSIRTLVANGDLKLQNGVSGTYDLQESNAQVHEVALDANLLNQLQVEVEPSKFTGKMDAKKDLSKTDSILAALDLLAGQQSQTAVRNLEDTIRTVREGVGQAAAVNFSFRQKAASQILHPWNIVLDDQGYLPVQAVLDNPGHLPLAQYYQEVRAAFKELGIELTEKLIEGRPYLFNEGHLSASDALTTTDATQQKRTVRAVVNMIKRWPKPDIAFQAVRANPALFQGTQPFQKLISQLSRGDLAEFKKLLALSDNGYQFSQSETAIVLEATEVKLRESGLDTGERAVLKRLLSVLVNSSSCDSALKAG